MYDVHTLYNVFMYVVNENGLIFCFLHSIKVYFSINSCYWRQKGAIIGLDTRVGFPVHKPNKIRQNIRLEEALWQSIDQARTQRAGNVSRNTWITEAILEKLGREQAQSPKQSVRSKLNV